MARKKKTLLDEDIDTDDILSIDKHALDDEWEDQPKRFGKYAKMLAKAIRRHDDAEAYLEYAKADLDQRIRKHPSKFGFDKKAPTEPGIKQAVILQEDYQEANKKVIESKHRVSVLNGIVRALDHRKKGLEKLADLWIGEYYSEPRASRHSRETMDEASKRKVRSKHRYKRPKKS